MRDDDGTLRKKGHVLRTRRQELTRRRDAREQDYPRSRTWLCILDLQGCARSVRVRSPMCTYLCPSCVHTHLTRTGAGGRYTYAGVRAATRVYACVYVHAHDCLAFSKSSGLAVLAGCLDFPCGMQRLWLIRPTLSYRKSSGTANAALHGCVGALNLPRMSRESYQCSRSPRTFSVTPRLLLRPVCVTTTSPSYSSSSSSSRVQASPLGPLFREHATSRASYARVPFGLARSSLTWNFNREL